MITAKALSELLDKLYSASESDAMWPLFLADLSKLLNLTGAAILYHDLEHGRYNCDYSWGNEAWKPGYHAYYGALDMWRGPFTDSKSAGQFAFGEELCPSREARKKEFYNDHLRKWDLDLLGAVATVKTKTQIENLSLFQSWKAPSSDPSAAMEMTELLFPHLQRALDLRRKFLRLRTYASALEQAIDLCESAIILVDHSGRISRLNKGAESIVAGKQGLGVRAGRLYACAADDQAPLYALIERVTQGRRRGKAFPGGSMLVSRTGRRPLAITVAPLPNAVPTLPSSAAAIVFVYDPDSRTQPPIDLLRDGYKLTSAEAQIAALLVESKSISQIAEDRAVTKNTVRQQLKSIFQKTGTHNQAGLIRLFMRGLPRKEGEPRPQTPRDRSRLTHYPFG